MENLAALTLWNQSRWLTHGVIGEDEVVQSLTPFGAVSNHCVGGNSFLNKSTLQPDVEQRRKAAAFLREWADAIHKEVSE